MPGPRKSSVRSGLSDVLHVRVEIDTRGIWKVLVKRVIARKGSGIKKGHTLGKIMIEIIEHEDFGDEEVVTLKKSGTVQGWCTVLKVVSTWVESRLREESIELTTCHMKGKWTIDTIDVDYKDQPIGYHLRTS